MNKKGHIVSDETIKWIISLAILVAAGLAVKLIFSKVAS
jgi:hypothetical protein